METEEEIQSAAARFEEIARLVAEQNADQTYNTYYDGNISVHAFEDNRGYDPNDNEYLQRIAEEA